MRVGALLALGWVQSIPASAPAPRWLTDLGEGVLGRCDLVLLARVERAAELGMVDFAATLIELKAHNFLLSPALERDFLEHDRRRKASRQTQKD